MINYNELRNGQKFYGNGYKKGYEDAKKEFERPVGEWIWFKGGYYKCNKCGEVERAKKNFCSRCGASMRKDSNDE